MIEHDGEVGSMVSIASQQGQVTWMVLFSSDIVIS